MHFSEAWTMSTTYMLAGHFNDEPGMWGGGPVIGERTPETVARVAGERGNELIGVGGVAGGVADTEERAENGKKEVEEQIDDVVIGRECGEVGELGMEIGLGIEKPLGTVGMTRGESLSRLDGGHPVPGSCLIF